MRRVLVVDDEEPVRDVLEDALCEDYELATAESGAVALARCDDFRPDVVLLDFNMPGMTGLDVLGALKARDASVEVILISGTTDPQLAATGFDLGAFAFLPKPFAISRVCEVVSAAVARRALKVAC